MRSRWDTDGVAALRAPYKAPPILLSSCILKVVPHMLCGEKSCVSLFFVWDPIQKSLSLLFQNGVMVVKIRSVERTGLPLVTAHRPYFIDNYNGILTTTKPLQASLQACQHPIDYVKPLIRYIRRAESLHMDTSIRRQLLANQS